MKTDLLLDVTELALKQLPKESSIGYVKIGKLYIDFVEGKTLSKSKASFSAFRAALLTMFPLYKNNHKNIVNYKISIKSAYSICESLSLKLRPVEHFQRPS